MASFVGDFEDFKKYIGPYVSNRVNIFTKKEKHKHHKICQHCKNTSSGLESCHVHGKGRLEIMQQAAQDLMRNGTIICTLSAIIETIEKLHYPIETSFLFLCKECHRKYDRENKQTANTTFQDKAHLKQLSNVKIKLADDLTDTDLEPKILRIRGVEFRLPREKGGVFQDDIKQLLTQLFEHDLLPAEEIEQLLQKDYSNKMLGIPLPLFVSNENEIDDATGHSRYWKKWRAPNGYYVCSQWWKDNFQDYNDAIQTRWIPHLQRINH